MGLTEAQLKTITGELFLFKDPPPALPRPINTDDGTKPTHLAALMKPVATNPRFKDISFGVVDFAAGPTKPRVFLHKDDTFWRMGSSGKIAALLAAAQLRDDVQKVKDTGFLTKDTEYDDLFATIWSRSKNLRVSAIKGKDGCPRVSTTIDVSKSQVNFMGADVPFDRTKLPRTDKWERMPDFSFRDRLWLMGSKSDNVAAGSCISEIGLAYMKAVQRAYGLWDDDTKKGMRMLVASHYAEVKAGTPVSRAAGAPKYRAFRKKDDESHLGVKDEYIDGTGKPHVTSQSGSVAAMAAFMIALIQNKFLNQGVSDAIKFFLADGGSDTLPGSLVHGVQAIATTFGKIHSKGGALNPEGRGRGAKLALRSDLAYIEADGKKYAIVAQGLLPFTVGGIEVEPDVQGQELAKAIHTALP
jgi:Beta-lactamase enzyme family